MKAITLFVISFFIMVTIAFAAEIVVTSKTLSIEDVSSFLTTQMYEAKYPIIEVVGIYQDGNTAKVFLKIKAPNGVFIRNSDLYRFNSGKWFSEYFGQFVVKK